MTDFPDFQQFPTAQSGNVFPSYTQTLIPGNHLGAVIPAQSWSSLIVIVKPSAGACQVVVRHFADAAGLNEIDSDTWHTNAATKIIVRTPLRGTYVRIDVNVTSGVNLTAVTWANFLSATSDRISFPVSQQNVSAFARALPASSTDLYTPGEIAAGRALFTFNPHDALGKLDVILTAVDENGNPGQIIAYWGQPTVLTQQLIVVPDLILQLKVQNQDAGGPHTYDFSLTIPPQ